MMRHFLSLATNMSEDKKAEIRDNQHKLHRRVPQLFEVKGAGLDQIEYLVDFIQDYVSFSFVRHPFER